MPGLIRDTFRLAWDAIYWNTRKSWHIARGRRGRCPCQFASDSGRGGQTGCEAVLAYASPGRFRTICPLLRHRATGDWVCSVDADQVRPFWGRAAALFSVSGLSTLLLISLIAFGVLRGIGYDVSYRQVAWPPAWKEFKKVQADFYRERAFSARAEGNLPESLLLLSNAYELDPGDYPTGRQLAQLWQANQPVLSDRTYARLLADHPEHRADTAQAWFRALLARGDFRTIQRLAGERLIHSDPPPSPAWLQAFFFATRRLNAPAAIDALVDEPGLPRTLLPMLARERELYHQPASRRIESLVEALDATREPFATYHWLGRLLDEGRADLVLSRLATGDSKLGNRERLRLQLDALAVDGRTSERTSLLTRLLASPTSAPMCELISSHLAAYPDRPLLAAYAEKLARDPLPPDGARYPQLLAFFVTCGAHRDAALMTTAAAWIDAALDHEFRTLTSAREAFMRFPSGARLENILPALQPMPLDTTYALYTRFAPPPPFPR